MIIKNNKCGKIFTKVSHISTTTNKRLTRDCVSWKKKYFYCEAKNEMRRRECLIVCVSLHPESAIELCDTEGKCAA